MTSPSAPAPVRSSRAPEAAMPTRLTVFMRTFLPWQIVRFAAINLKMVRLIWRSH